MCSSSRYARPFTEAGSIEQDRSILIGEKPGLIKHPTTRITQASTAAAVTAAQQAPVARRLVGLPPLFSSPMGDDFSPADREAAAAKIKELVSTNKVSELSVKGGWTGPFGGTIRFGPMPYRIGRWIEAGWTGPFGRTLSFGSDPMPCRSIGRSIAGVCVHVCVCWPRLSD